MKIVIDIEAAIYKECIPYKDTPIISNLANYNSEIIHAIANGTPLPDGVEILTKEAYSDLCTRAAEQPEKHTEERTESHACDCVSREAAIDALEKCYTCKHVYQRISDADTLYCRCRKGCRYEEFKPKRSSESPRGHEG